MELKNPLETDCQFCREELRMHKGITFSGRHQHYPDTGQMLHPSPFKIPVLHS